MADITIRATDRLPILDRFLTVDDVAVNLSGVTSVKFYVINSAGAVVINNDCSIISATAGHVSYAWTTQDAALPNGFYAAYFVVTYPTGETLTLPNSGYLSMHITDVSAGTFTYSGDPGFSQKDGVRFWVQDTDPNAPLLTDQEIQYVINTWFGQYNSLIYCAAVAAETISAKFAREVAYAADGVSVGVQELQQKYNILAESLRDMFKNEFQNIDGAPDVGGIMWPTEYDPSIAPTSFWKGMTDNRRAGQQDYGGQIVRSDQWDTIYGTWGSY